jgi:hypothetical protein
MSTPQFRASLTNAIRYWERGRLIYNFVLLGVVGSIFLFHLPQSQQAISFDLLQGLFVLAVLANVAYCAAYLVDLVVQSSGYQAAWFKFRWVLLVLGILFASVITQFVARGMFASAT